MTLFPLAIYFFTNAFVKDKKAAFYAALFSVFLPSVLQATYSFGQFPTLFALVAALFSIAFLCKFIVNKSWMNLLTSLGLLGVAVGAHHFTAVFLVPFLVSLLMLSFLLERREIPKKSLFLRILVFSVLGLLLCLIVIYPYWKFSFYNSVNLPIPHLSRMNVLTDGQAFQLFFWNMYSSIILLVPFFCLFSI